MFSAQRSDFVNANPAVVRRQPPLGCDYFGLKHPLKRRIEGTFFDLKQIAG
jgi:hypothetical protein